MMIATFDLDVRMKHWRACQAIGSDCHINGNNLGKDDWYINYSVIVTYAAKTWIYRGRSKIKENVGIFNDI